jgi:hypothetical protein
LVWVCSTTCVTDETHRDGRDIVVAQTGQIDTDWGCPLQRISFLEDVVDLVLIVELGLGLALHLLKHMLACVCELDNQVELSSGKDGVGCWVVVDLVEIDDCRCGAAESQLDIDWRRRDDLPPQLVSSIRRSEAEDFRPEELPGPAHDVEYSHPTCTLRSLCIGLTRLPFELLAVSKQRICHVQPLLAVPEVDVVCTFEQEALGETRR